MLCFGPVAYGQWTVVSSGSSSVFNAPNAGAVAYAWTLDGSSVGSTSSSFTYSPGNYDVGSHVLSVAQTLATGGTSASQWGVRVKIPIPSGAVRLYVSPSGSDSNNGTIGAPFKTLEAAQQAIRALPRPLPAGGVTVYLRGGTYWRTSTFTLTGSDSGSPAAPVVYSSYPGENAVISTGTPVLSASWAPLAASQQSRVVTTGSGAVDVTRIWETDVSQFTNKGPYPAGYSTWPVRNTLDTKTASVPDVFYHDARAWLSRYPNHNAAVEYLTPDLSMDGVAADISGTSYLNSSGTYLSSSGSAIAVGGAFHYYPSDSPHVTRWKSALAHGGVWVQGFWRVIWQCNLAQVLDIDTTNQVIELAPGSTPQGGFGSAFSRPIGNKSEPYWVVNLLEEMDEPGEWCVDFSRKKLYFLMDQAGAPPDNSVVIADYTGPIVSVSGSNVIFQSLTFDESLGEGIVMPNGSHNLIVGCTFRNLTNMAVDIQGGAQNGVVSCDLHELGSMGIRISATSNATSSSPPQANYVVNNNMTGLSRYAQVYEPGVNLTYPTSGNRVAHNAIFDTPQMGVQFAGYNNLYEYNNIWQHGTIVNDTAAFYSYADNYGGDTFRFNYTHDTPTSAAISYDGNHTATGNFFGNLSQMNAQCEGSSIGVGLVAQINCVDNMSIGGGRYGSFNFTADHQCNINNNVAVAGYYPPDFHWTLLTYVSGTAVNTPTTEQVLANGPNISYPADPGFINMTGEDLRLRPDAQVLKDLPAFQPIPFEIIGLYNDEYRGNGAAYPPYVTAYGGTLVGSSNALLSGTLVYPQFDANTSVSIYYGPVDSGTNAGNWSNSISLGTVTSGSFSALVGPVAANQPLYFRVLATNPAGQSWSANTAAAYPSVPSSPSGVTVTPGYAQNVVSWNAATYAAGYLLQRATSPAGPFVTIASITSGTSYVDTDLTTGVSYYYSISAMNSSGSSSGTLSAAGVPTPGTAVKANNTDSLDQGVSWSKGATPTAFDNALWDSTYTYGSVSVGNGLTASEIQVTSPLQPVLLSASTGTIYLSAVSGTGIDLSAAAQNLTIAAPVTLGASQSWVAASGRTLTASGGISAAGNYALTLSGSGTFVFAGTDSWPGAIIVGPPAGGLPTYKFGGDNPSPYLQLSGSAGSIVANGRVDLEQGSAVGTLSGSGSAGQISNFSTGNNPLTFRGGSSFSMFGYGTDYSSATLQTTGTAPVYFAYYGYNTSAPHAAYTINGGLWLFNQIGQNNTGSQTSGATTVTGSASVTISTQCSYAHGTWNVINGSLRFSGGINEYNGSTAGTNTALVLNVNGSGGGPGNLTINGGLALGAGGSSMEANAVTIGAGGTFTLLNGGITLGTTGTQAGETDVVTLQAGGKLSVNGTIAALSVVAGQTRSFIWTGGQLTALGITTGPGFATPGGGGITPATLMQTGGTLAPGDMGTAGKTNITGNYNLGPAGTLAVNLGGSTQATGFQSGQYDYVAVSGSTILSGSLSIGLINGFVPSGSQTFIILSSNAGISGGFANLAPGNRIISVDGKSSFLVSSTAGQITLGGYATILPPVVLSSPTSATILTGASVAFSVGASASAVSPNSYQWRVGGVPIPGATSATYTISAAQLSNAGVYDAVVTNSAGSVTSGAAVLTVRTPLQAWRAAYFGTTNNSGSASDLAAPNGDNIPNLMKYALGLNPYGPATAFLPALNASNGFLSLTFKRAAPDVTFYVEGSFDLIHWTTVATNPGTPGLPTTVLDNVPFSSGNKRFLRLRVTDP